MKLYIIGNGFDLHHGLPTSYGDYKRFLNKKYARTVQDYEDFVGIHNKKKEAWKDIENALKVDYRKVLSRYADRPSTMDIVTELEQNKDQYSYIHNDLEDAMEGLTNFITNFTGLFLFRWLKSIDVKQAEGDLSLSPDDIYVTFNYTNTLEKIYHIPDSHVFHIHGSLQKLKGLMKQVREYKEEYIAMEARDYGEEEARDMWKYREGPWFFNLQFRQEIQFGAAIDRYKQLNTMEKWYAADKEMSEYVDAPIRTLDRFMDRSTKDIRKNFYPLFKFIDPFKEYINTVEIMGHSLASIDDPYYSEILIPIFEDFMWVFYAYKGNRKDIDAFIRKFRIKYYRVISW